MSSPPHYNPACSSCSRPNPLAPLALPCSPSFLLLQTWPILTLLTLHLLLLPQIWKDLEAALLTARPVPKLFLDPPTSPETGTCCSCLPTSPPQALNPTLPPCPAAKCPRGASMAVKKAKGKEKVPEPLAPSAPAQKLFPLTHLPKSTLSFWASLAASLSASAASAFTPAPFPVPPTSLTSLAPTPFPSASSTSPAPTLLPPCPLAPTPAPAPAPQHSLSIDQVLVLLQLVNTASSPVHSPSGLLPTVGLIPAAGLKTRIHGLPPADPSLQLDPNDLIDHGLMVHILKKGWQSYFPINSLSADLTRATLHYAKAPTEFDIANEPSISYPDFCEAACMLPILIGCHLNSPFKSKIAASF
ncbi:hypothetical protein BDR03DRAFT_1017253 [Suillus americanus]|nr:hypothetical protein BDR03DRAFT_1017253 [Suillus americanus]